MGNNAKAAVVTALLATIFVSVASTDAWNQEARAQESIHGIAVGLFDTYVIAFLVLSVLLTGALLGAVYLGIREVPSDEEDSS